MRFVALTIFILSLAACRSTRQIGTAIQKKDTIAHVVIDSSKNDTAKFIRNTMSLLNSNRINYKTFNGKINVDYKGGDGKKYDLNVNIRMYRDSAIWISANAILGIEALRVLVTRDSIKLLNKLEKVYTARSIDYIQDVTSLPLNLHTLQELLIGNPVFVDSTVVSVSAKGNTLSVISVSQWFKNLLTLDAANGMLLSSKLDDLDIARSRTADLGYDEYENKKGYLFATKRRISVSEKTRLEIKLDFKQYELNNEVSFPFSIPRNYDRN
jgi:hypothetical protein